MYIYNNIYINIKLCIILLLARDLKSVTGLAFDRTCKLLPTQIDALGSWIDDGAEEEVNSY